MIILFIFLAYIIGSIPFGYILVRCIAHVDIRTVGSGNIGATNAGRVLGKWGFISVFILDFLKGFVPIYLVKIFYGAENYFLPLVALAVTLGHMFTIFLKFKGGKGVATGLGIFTAIDPVATLVGILIFAITAFISKMVSLSSIIASISIAIYIWVYGSLFFLKITVTIIVLLIIYRHKDNIKRICQGKENKIGVRIDKS
jgi:glycerol-3-phosphate acyltransferase PlsY